MRYRPQGQTYFDYAQTDNRLKHGLIGHWTGLSSGRTLFDRSGGNNHGITSAATPASWVAGKIGPAARFINTEDHFQVTNFNHNIGTGDFTLSAWVIAYALTNYDGIMSFGAAAPNFAVNAGGGSGQQWGSWWDADRFSGRTLELGRWYHLVMRRSGTTVTFHQDGVQTPTSHTIATSITSTSFRIGGNGITTGRLNGVVNDARVYNRALSAAEITLLYSQGSPKTVFSPVRRSIASVSSSGLTTHVSDSLTLLDFVDGQLAGALSVAVSDTLTINEGVSTSSAFARSVSDTLSGNNALAFDPFSGTDNTPLATYDTSYANARTSYNVNQLVLDGLGNVKLVSGAGSSGGFSYPKSGSQRNDGQISQMVLLPRNGAAVSNPYMRLLVQTTSAGSQYYGVELLTSSSGNYSQYSWYRGSTAIGGMTSLSVAGTYSVESSVIVRLVTQMVSATVQRVTYYIGATESSLVEQSWIEVTNGSGMTDSSTSATDATVPWSVGGWPGMLHHNNSGNLNALFTEFSDGISWGASSSLTDSASRVANFTGTVSEALSLLDAVARVHAVARTTEDALALNDAQQLSAAFSRMVAEGVTIDDAVASLLSFVIAVSDSFTLSDTSALSAAFRRSLSDGLTIGEAIAQAIAFAYELQESLALTENVASISAYLRQIDSSLSITDNLLTAAYYLRSSSDSLSFSEDLSSRLFSGVAATSELTLGDNVSVVRAFAVQFVDALVLAENTAYAAQYFRTGSSNLSVADLAAFANGFARSASSSVIVGDAVNRSANFVTVAADSFSLASSATGSILLGAYAASAFSLADLVATNSQITVAVLPPIYLRTLNEAVSTLGESAAEYQSQNLTVV